MYSLKNKVSEKLSSLFTSSRGRSSSARYSPKTTLNSTGSLPAQFSISSLYRKESLDRLAPPPIRHHSYNLEEEINFVDEDQFGFNTSNDEAKRADSNGDTEKSPMPCLTEESAFISVNLYDFLMACLPNMIRGRKWVLLYSTKKHGISLRTLVRKSAEHPGPCLLISGDKAGATFGAMFESPLIPTPRRKYQGTNQTLLFTTIHGEPHLFRPTGVNRYYVMCMKEFLAFGGANFALWLNEDLLTGKSGSCETFGNRCLSSSEEFEITNLELWGFEHPSRYRSSIS